MDEIIISIYKNDLYYAVAINSLTNKIEKIFLPKTDRKETLAVIKKYYTNFELSDQYKDILKDISRIHSGKKVDFDLEMLELRVDRSNKNLPVKTPFIRDVLLQTHKIPYGEVETYKSLAEKLETRAYRAVGTALSKNPFPLVIPCHRVVKSDLNIGKYGGGREMKKEILKREGVKIKGEKIIKNKIISEFVDPS